MCTNIIRSRAAVRRGWLRSAILLSMLGSPGIASATEGDFAGMIRTKLPDRDSYQPPTLPQAASAEVAADQATTAANRGSEVADRTQAGDPDRRQGLHTVAVTDVATANPAVAQANHEFEPEPPALGNPHPSLGETMHAYPDYREDGHWEEAPYGYPAEPYPAHGRAVYGEYDGACDSYCGGHSSCCGHPGTFGPGGFRFCGRPNQWFGSVELMLMFRKGDVLPPLVTTSASGDGDGSFSNDFAADTRVLLGNERLLRDMTAGGRVTLGTWLDDCGIRSLVFRGWGAGRETFHFRRDSNGDPVLARPFLNTGENPAEQQSLIIAGDGTPGTVRVDGANEVYGGDAALRHVWLSGLGGVVEVLYGYQYMGMRDELNISSNSIPVPALDVRDRFRADNEFHGGQLGLAARYREGCWSFNGLIKASAGSIRRSALLEGSTVIGGFSDPGGGLLVRNATNAGRFSDSTFGWVPELDATLGWRYTRNLDFTFGYHVIAMTDALQASGMIDPRLAVNTDFPNPNPADPSASFRYETFYVHGIHFGLQLVY